MQELVDLRREAPWDLEDLRRRPFGAGHAAPAAQPDEPRATATCCSRSRAPRCSSTSATTSRTGLVAERPSARRGGRCSWPLDALRRDHGVERVEVVDPDALPRRPRRRPQPAARRGGHRGLGARERRADARGTRALRPAVPVVRADPRRPRAAARAEPVRWHEYELTVHPLPGHTLYAAAIEFEVDGKRVLVTRRPADATVRERDPRTTSTATGSASTTTSRAPSSTASCGPT